MEEFIQKQMGTFDIGEPKRKNVPDPAPKKEAVNKKNHIKIEPAEDEPQVQNRIQRTIYMPSDLYEKIEDIRFENRRSSFSDVVNEALADLVKKYRK